MCIYVKSRLDFFFNKIKKSFLCFDLLTNKQKVIIQAKIDIYILNQTFFFFSFSFITKVQKKNHPPIIFKLTNKNIVTICSFSLIFWSFKALRISNDFFNKQKMDGALMFCQTSQNWIHSTTPKMETLTTEGFEWCSS